MPSLYMPGAILVRGKKDGGSMLGGPARATWHTFEADPKSLSAKRGAERLVAAGNDIQLVFNPISGEIATSVPANRAGRALKNAPGGVQTNRFGSVNIQVEVIAYASRPFTDYITPAGKEGLRAIIAWMHEWGVPYVWPSGAPVSYAPNYPASHYPRNVQNWKTKAGHYSHSQVPENYHGDPGKIDISLWTPVKPAPRPDPTPRPQPAAVPFVLRRYLRLTDARTSGTDVLVVAKKLKLVSATATGTAVYGPRMRAAVVAYQREKNLTVDGVVGRQVAGSMKLGFKLP